MNNSVTLYSDKNLRLQNFYLDGVAAFIWNHCDGSNSNKDIAIKLFSELEDNKPSIDEIQSDIDSFLLELKHNGLVSWNENYLDVLFVIPPFHGIYSKRAIENPESSSPPLGVAYIAAILKNSSYKIDILDMHIKALDFEDIIKCYQKLNPKIVALSATTPTFPSAIKITKLLKAWDNSVITIIGGIHATCVPEECILEESIDYVIVGEGEFTMLELVNNILHQKNELCNIRGLVYKDNNEIVVNKPRERLQNLDKLPFPARELLDINAYYQKGSIVSSRGCPYHCNYCSCSVIAGHTYRVHSVNYVLNEIEFLIGEYGFKYFDFHDDTFNFYPQRVFEFCQEIRKRDLKFEWGCFCRVTNFNYDIAKSMVEAGCNVIQFGVEAGNQTVLNSIKKRIKLEEVENAIISAKKAGIEKIACGFIIGHAIDTEDTVNETIDFGLKLSELGATDLSISVLTPYPGTEVYNNLGRNGITLLTKDWGKFIFSRVLIETKNISKECMRELYVKGVTSFLSATNRSSENAKNILSENGKLTKKMVLLLAHYDFTLSKVNRALINQIKTIPQIKIIDLYSASMDFEFYRNILTDADFLVIQFPMCWGSAPSRLKEWIDTVFTKLALNNSQILQNKSLLIVTTTGATQEAYTPQGRNKYTTDELLSPYKLLTFSSKMNWEIPFVIYGTESIDSNEKIECIKRKYYQRIIDLINN